MNKEMEWKEILIHYANHKVMSPTDYENGMERVTEKSAKIWARVRTYGLIFGVLCFGTVVSFAIVVNTPFFWALLAFTFVLEFFVALALRDLLWEGLDTFTWWQGELGPRDLGSVATQIEESESVELAAIVRGWLNQHGILRQKEKHMVQVACEVHRQLKDKEAVLNTLDRL